MTEEEFRKAADHLGICLDDHAFERFEIYADLLKEWNAKFNLTAIDEKEEVYEKHFLDCLIPLTLCEISGITADVGSGAGFPGMVWAIAKPQLPMILIEPTGKRVTFLEQVKHALALEEVTVINSRAEDCANFRESCDVVTARAVAPLSILSELCVPMVKPGGSFISMKGARGKEEYREAEAALRLLGCEENRLISYTLLDKEERTLIVSQKTAHTPGKYPRNYSQIKKAPLKAK